MKNVRLFKDVTNGVNIKAPYLFSIQTETIIKPYVPSTKNVTAATINVVDGAINVEYEKKLELQEIKFRINANIPSSAISCGDDECYLNFIDGYVDKSEVFDNVSFSSPLVDDYSIALPSDILDTYDFSPYYGEYTMYFTLKTCTLPSSIFNYNDIVINIDGLLKGVKIVEEYSLYLLSRVESMTIPSTVTEIGYANFGALNSLNELLFEENSQLTSVGDQCFWVNYEFYEQKNQCLNLPSTIKKIGSGSFSYLPYNSVKYDGKTYTSRHEFYNALLANGVELTKVNIYENGKIVGQDYDIFDFLAN